jgi:hypothetical protein
VRDETVESKGEVAANTPTQREDAVHLRHQGCKSPAMLRFWRSGSKGRVSCPRRPTSSAGVQVLANTGLSDRPGENGF